MIWLRHLAAQAPVPVYACIGPDMQAAVERMGLSRFVAVRNTPRAAAILLVAGDMPERAQEALDRLHDQVPHPRATVAWDGTGDPVANLRKLWRNLLDGLDSESDRLPDTPPNAWRGVGENGQGGTGMMAGVPYGRPMAMTADDPRDGLALDAYTARVGPFAPMLPPGLVLEVTLQGDVIVTASVCAPPFAQTDDASSPDLCAARMLRLLGLPIDARRMVTGSKPRALAYLRVAPEGLGRADDGDARKRLSAWLSGQQGPDAAPKLSDLLPGLEWSEAMLAINSYSPAALRRTCLNEADE